MRALRSGSTKGIRLSIANMFVDEVYIAHRPLGRRPARSFRLALYTKLIRLYLTARSSLYAAAEQPMRSIFGVSAYVKHRVLRLLFSAV